VSDPATSHKVLVGIVIMIVMLIILTEVAGVNHDYAVLVGLLLLGPLLLEGMNHSQQLGAWLQNNPYNPN
jgi:hypothetical protein